MLVSRVRETADHRGERALAVDVVFNPWVIRCSSHEHHFRSQVRRVCMCVFLAFWCFGVFRSPDETVLRFRTQMGPFLFSRCGC